MDQAKKLDIAFVWHMHQPCYKDTLSGKYLMPWVRLHGVKDYFPMAALIKNFENIKMTFNIVPVLAEQINDYAENEASDLLLDLTLKKASDLAVKDKVEMLEYFFRVNFKRFIEPNARYSELLLKKGMKPLAGAALRKVLKDFTDQDFLDLAVLFNLAWFHSITIDEDANLKGLISKKSYTEEDKEYVIFKQREVLAQILPLYKRLQDDGRIEITTTPFYHPILPLLCDTSIAKISMPGAELPHKRFAHPEDARRQVEEAIKHHTADFGRAPNGMWPSEGSVSDEALDIIMSAGIKWVATDEDILFKSLALYDKSYKGKALLDRRLIYQPYLLKKGSGKLAMIFRDKNLSDMISFSYNAWNPRDAAMDLLGHFKKISENLRRDTDTGLATIVMDGENAWEYYEDNGRAFFETLYSNLNKGENVTTNTISGYLENEPPRRGIASVFPGSWINHNFDIWIGQEQDNVSWDYLYKVRGDLVEFTKESQKHGRPDPSDIQRAWREIYISEGSDWNWWYAGKVHSGARNPFDKLYINHLKNVYKILKKPIPEFLKISIA